jgi:hypothetical protein
MTAFGRQLFDGFKQKGPAVNMPGLFLFEFSAMTSVGPPKS